MPRLCSKIGSGWEPQPLPYGTRPRLVLVNICSEAVRTRRRTVDVGDSVRAFLRRLGIDAGGHSMAGFKRQMIALACCHRQLGYRTERGVGQVDGKPISRFEAWLADEDRQRGLWPGELDLSGPLFDSLIEHAVPLDAQALAGLQNSALALDVYTWLAHRLWRVASPAGTLLSWRALKEQFGQEYADVREFRRSFLEATRRAVEVYREARLEVVRGGLRLLPSPAPVKRSAVAGRRVSGVAKPAAIEAKRIAVSHAITTPERRDAMPSSVPPPLSAEALARVKAIAKGFDAATLWAMYQPMAGDAADVEDRFVAWVRAFTRGRNGLTSEAAGEARSEADRAGGGIVLKHATIMTAADRAPGHDIQWLERQFIDWNRGRGVVPRDPDAAFLAWVPSFTKR